jgi:hypothetical protein
MREKVAGWLICDILFVALVAIALHWGTSSMPTSHDFSNNHPLHASEVTNFVASIVTRICEVQDDHSEHAASSSSVYIRALATTPHSCT